MRLAEFIVAYEEKILAEWEAFARTCVPAARPMDIEALRDHAAAMLTVIAEDLGTPQSRVEQSEKSKGRGPSPSDITGTAAGQHGAGRAESGFTIDQMVAEYRALRASVIRLWADARGSLATPDIEDLIRFNEAIDQSLAESVAAFNHNVEEAKETFLAILGHDLRTPLGAIRTSAQFMLDSGDLEEPNRTLVARIEHSAQRSMAMVGDLLDFTRSRLGGGIPVERAEADLGRIVREVVDEVAAAYPACHIHVDTRGEQRGRWDAARLTQALGNLVGNAAQHAAEGTDVTIDLHGTEKDITVAVHNRGAVIPPEQLDGLFNPMKAQQEPHPEAARGPTGNLGLGLYIAERIISAHEGWLEVESSEHSGTTFTVHLPR
jgi:signal transduction histidine kinase